MAHTSESKRWLILVAACATAGMTGATYMWSIFTAPLIQAHGWTSSEVSSAYSLYFVMQFLMGWAAGALQRRLGTRPLAIVGDISYSLGWILMSHAHTIPLLYLTFSLLGGAGAGLAYNASVSTATKWFPDRKGLASGLCIGATGLMPAFFAPLGNYVVQNFDLSTGLVVAGAIPLAVYLAFSWFVTAPAEGWKPAGWEPEATKASSSRDYSTREMLRTPLFWCMFAVFTAATSSGAMITSHAASIGAEFVSLGAQQAALQVSLLAVGNFLGRFGFGTLSDHIGRFNTLLITLGTTLLDMLVVLPMAGGFASFAVAMMIAGACYGGALTVMPSLCGDLFGMRDFGQNYGILYGGFALANLVGPMAAASIVDATGSYANALFVAAGLATCGIVLVLVLRALAARR